MTSEDHSRRTPTSTSEATTWCRLSIRLEYPPSDGIGVGGPGRARHRKPYRRMLLMNREPLVEDIQNYALNIVDTVREPLLILDATLRVRSANRAFYQTFQVTAEQTVDRLI